MSDMLYALSIIERRALQETTDQDATVERVPAHRHPLCRASLHRAPPDGAAELPTLWRWTRRSWRRADWGPRRGSTTGEMWLCGGCRLSKESVLVLRYLLRCKGLARSPFYLTLPFRLGGVPPRQSHETEAAVAVHGRGRMVQRLALTKRWSIGRRFLLWDRPRSASMSVLRHGSRRTPKLTPPSMPRMYSGQRFCKGGPSPNAGQTLPFVHHDTVTTRPAQSWDIRAEDFLDSSCTSACGLHMSFFFTASTPRVLQVLEVAALSVGRLASGSEHLWASTRMRPASHCFRLFFFVPSAASISDCLQREISRAPSVAGPVFRPWRQQLHSAILAISLDVRSSAQVDLLCTLTYRNVSHVAAVCAGLRLSISMLVPLPWIAQCHTHSAWPPVGFVDMLSRLAKKAGGRLNRLYTDPESTGEIGGTGPAATQPADDWRRSLPEHVFLPASAPEHALTPRELALYNYTTWRTREPPPPTIYIRGALQALLRAHPRRSLVVDCDEPSPVISVEEDDPPSRPASETQAGPTDERRTPAVIQLVTLRSSLACSVRGRGSTSIWMTTPPSLSRRPVRAARRISAADLWGPTQARFCQRRGHFGEDEESAATSSTAETPCCSREGRWPGHGADCRPAVGQGLSKAQASAQGTIKAAGSSLCSANGSRDF